MSFSSTAFLTDRENLATGTVIATGTYKRYKESTAMADRNKWFAGLTPEQREQLKQEAEYEESKMNYQQ